MDKKVYSVTWEGRDGDGSAVVRTSGDHLAAIRAACPEDMKVVGPMDFQFVTNVILYVPKDMRDGCLTPEDEPEDIHGVYMVGAIETEIIEA